MPINVKHVWKSSDEVLSAIPEYYIVYLGRCDVDPSKIIGLNWPYLEVANDEKMKRLIASVNKNGWNDPMPNDLDLYYLPTGNFVVSHGGDHRSLLSRELGIPNIKATVDIIIPKGEVTKEAASKIKEFEEYENECELKAKKVNKFLKSKGVYRDDFVEEEKQFEQYCDAMDLAREQRNNVLKNEAKRLGYLPPGYTESEDGDD